MLDIMLTEDGDISIDGSDFKTVTKDDLRFQYASCQLKSVIGDWYDEDDLGANLENIIGMPNTISTAKSGKDKILNAIISNGVFVESEVHIEYKVDRHLLEYTVYLRNIDMLTSKVLVVSLDLVKGVNIRIGVD